MCALNLLAELHELNIKIHLDGDTLRLRLPDGDLDPELRARLKAHKSELVAFLRESSVANFPLSRGQRRMWVLDRLIPNPPAFANTFAAHVFGPMDPSLLEVISNCIVARHQALRTSFRMFGMVPRQVVKEDARLDVGLVDLGQCGKGRERATLDNWLQWASNLNFHLERGPLLRVVLLRLDKNRHVLFISMHRLVADNWSIGIFLRELELYFQAALHGGPDPFDSWPKQYMDFVLWQQSWLDNKALFERQRDYWCTQLAGGLHVLELAGDRPRPRVFTYRSAHQKVVIPHTTYAGIRRLAEREGVNLFVVLLAAFKTLLYRFTGRRDILVGSPISDRNRSETQDSMGFFSNWHVLRTDLGHKGGHISFRELLARVQEVTLAAKAHRDLPFGRLIEEMKPERNLSRHPLFQIALILRRANMPLPKLGVPMGLIPKPGGTSELDVTLILGDSGAGLEGVFDYNVDLFERETIARLAAHFQILLQGIISFPDAALAELPILSKEERRRLLQAWNDTSKDFSKLCLHELFEAQVSRSPTATALDFEGEEMTYLELHQRSTALAYFLRSLGVGTEVPVAICLERSFEMFVAILGILRAGGVYVPLEPDYPRERQKQVLLDVAAPVLVTRFAMAEHLPRHRGQNVYIDTEQHLFEKALSNEPLYGGKPLNLANILFTAGAGGVPMGVMATHLYICNRLLWMRDTFHVGRRARVLLKTPFTFDISVWEMFLPLISGSRVVIAKPGGHQNPAYLVSLLARKRVTLAHFTPSMLRAVLDEPALDSPNHLRQVLCSEEALARLLHERFRGRWPEARLYNFYGGPALCLDVSAWDQQTDSRWQSVPLGLPISNMRSYVLDAFLQTQPLGVEGELHLSGMGLARGILNAPRITAARLIPDPFGNESGGRLFKTGDLVRTLADGNMEFLGHIDAQKRVAGSRIEYGEIKAVLTTIPGVREAMALTRENKGEQTLVAYYIPGDEEEPDVEEMRNELKKILPNYMCPKAFVRMEAFPLTPNGRIDRGALRPPPEKLSDREMTYARAFSQVERSILDVWKQVLNIERITAHDDFFQLGGDSLRLMRVYDKLPEILRQDLKRIDLFKHPSIHDLAFFLEEEENPEAVYAVEREYQKQRNALLAEVRAGQGMKIAIIGMAFRFPGASNLDELWKVLREGGQTISKFDRETLLQAGVDEAELANPNYVPYRAVLAGLEDFDHAFFGFTPREAQLTDPQHRIFLECCWEALEHAGHAADKYPHPIGLFAGAGHNHYLDGHLLPNKELMETAGWFPVMICNTKDNLCPRVSYKLGLSGPSLAVQTACSTSLVAVHMACLSLLAGDCQMALVGGVSLGGLRNTGYLYEEGMLAPPDGIGRCFDAEASGTVPGQGAGVVVLKGLEGAVEDGDHIYAVLRGSAVNNDGSGKANYTTYSVEGQTRVINRALEVACVSPADIDYVETSSNASKLGDPIEIQSLSNAYRAGTDKLAYCALGAVKPNLGNLDTASGMAALIKAVLCLYHGEIPANINFREADPDIDFENSPFYVNTRLRAWPAGPTPRRAGVNSFGLGGTNAHLVLEQAPPALPAAPARPWQLLTLSAKTPKALEKETQDLVDYLKHNPHANFSEVGFSLHVGRQDFKYRRVLACQNLHEAVLELERSDSPRVYTSTVKTHERPVTFMFPGQGSQYINMGRELFRKERRYREVVEQCWEIIREHVPKLHNTLSRHDRAGRTEKLNRTYVTQPTLFITEYALARLLMSWGIQPQAMIGNSLGEYVAACISGVFSLTDALDAMVTRGRLMQKLPPGTQLFVSLPEAQLQHLLHDKLSIAAVLGEKCVLSGSKEAINEVRNRLIEKGVKCRRNHTAHAFHSAMMTPILPEFIERLKRFKLQPPKIPFISNLTGTWITDVQATDPFYWARHLREPVRFGQGMAELYKTPNRIFLEVGPDRTLSAIAIAFRPDEGNFKVLGTMPQPLEEESDTHYLFNTLGRLWLAGVDIDWKKFHDTSRRRLSLPTYPFDRVRHWVEPRKKKEQTFWLAPDQIEDAVDDGLDDDHFRPGVATGFVEPRNDMEQAIAKVWGDALGLKELGIHDDFFELGGTSLIAVRLTANLSQYFHLPIASHTLIKNRTIGMVAEFIAEHRASGAGGASDSPIVEIQRGNPRVMPLFMVHPVGGEVYFYKDLAGHLGARQPFYGIQAPSLLGKMEPFNDIVKQATYYLEELLRFQPKPPYLLGGGSYGGVVAYEMSQQLHARGIPVALTVLIDSPAPGAMPARTEDFADILDYLLGDELEFDVHELRELEPEEQLSYIFDEARHVNRLDILPASLGIPLFKTWMAHQDAMHSYVPKPYPGRVIFFRPTEVAKLNVPNMHLPWIDLVQGGIEIHKVPGNHITMNAEPNVKEIGVFLRRALHGSP